MTSLELLIILNVTSKTLNEKKIINMKKIVVNHIDWLF